MLARVASRSKLSRAVAPRSLYPRLSPAAHLSYNERAPAPAAPTRHSAAAAKMAPLAVDKFGAVPAVQTAEYVMTQFDRLANWARKSSMWPMTFGLA